MAFLRLEEPGLHLGPAGKIRAGPLRAPEKFGVQLEGILHAELALIHQGAELSHGGLDGGGVRGLPLQGQHHAAAGPVFPDAGEAAPLYGVARAGTDPLHTPPLAMFLADAQAEGVKPLLLRCHGSDVRQSR